MYLRGVRFQMGPVDCPNCKADLRTVELVFPLQCPFCRQLLKYSWSYRVLPAFGSIAFAIGVPIMLGLPPVLFFLAALPCQLLGIVCLHFFLLRYVPPTSYIVRNPTVTTLFR